MPPSPTSCRVRASTARWCRWANNRNASEIRSVTLARIRLALFVLAGFAVGGVAALALFPAAREKLLPQVSAVRSVGQAMIGGPFELTDHTGKRVSDRDYRGKYMLVFFGFTLCP